MRFSTAAHFPPPGSVGLSAGKCVGSDQYPLDGLEMTRQGETRGFSMGQLAWNSVKGRRIGRMGSLTSAHGDILLFLFSLAPDLPFSSSSASSEFSS